MLERAHPEHPGYFKWFGLRRTKYAAQLYQRYDYCAPYCRGRDVLDVPCGVGWGTSRLKGCRTLTGIDRSLEALEYGGRHYRGIRFLAAHVAALPLPDVSMDVVICLEGLEHFPREVGDRFLEEVTRILRPNGHFILTTPVLNERSLPSGNEYHLHEYDDKELTYVLAERFRFIRYELNSGADGPLVRFVGKKRSP